MWRSWKKGADREKDRNESIGENLGGLKVDEEEKGRDDEGSKGEWSKEEVREGEGNKIMLINLICFDLPV